LIRGWVGGIILNKDVKKLLVKGSQNPLRKLTSGMVPEALIRRDLRFA
jgi:hypothetical protein